METFEEASKRMRRDFRRTAVLMVVTWLLLVVVIGLGLNWAFNTLYSSRHEILRGIGQVAAEAQADVKAGAAGVKK